MKLEEFDYHLPEELIAQEPIGIRDQARLMVVHRESGGCEIRTFSDLPEYVGRGDAVVINDSRVFPARLIGSKETGGLIEILLLVRKGGEEAEGETWEALLRPAKRVQVETTILFDGGCRATVVARLSEKRWLLNFKASIPFDDFLTRHGRAPLPPYIRRRRDRSRSEADLERYQTVYARVKGSVAAPTAGLHFTGEVLERLRSRGAAIVAVTLHVGYGTFMPIQTDRVEDHVMEEERFFLSEESAGQINAAKRVIAVGTTTTRVLESVADGKGKVDPASGSTRLYIRIPFPPRRCAPYQLPSSEVVPFSSGLRLRRAGGDGQSLPLCR
jgi:S-adenosylmethionine:tRNA ribosyltransferase-isomerase